MALNTILEKLHEERRRLTEELDRVVRMIRAAGKGAEAALQQYGRRTRMQRRAKAGAVRKKKISAASRIKMAQAQRARRARERAAGTAKKSPKTRRAKAKTAKAQAPIL